MESSDHQYFELLKMEIVSVMQRSYPGISDRIDDWKGKDIIAFQEDLRKKVNSYFSEKWFYNHFKSVSEKLPRIDTLNILCRYTGHIDWAEFKHKNRDKIALIIEHKGSNRIFYILPVIAGLFFALVWMTIKLGSVATYRFCFVDSYSKNPILNADIEVTLLLENESPRHFLCDSAGCFVYRTGASRLRFIAQSPYYDPDTINRVLNKANRSEVIQLKINDYALMLDYFSNAMVEDWQKRKEQLSKIIADSAYICQVYYEDMLGMELYNKEEFIDLLTTPTTGLKHIKILELFYQDDKIISLRFTKGN